jgi:putative transcriptional regulator
MNKDDFESLKRGLAQVEAYKAGERKGYVVHEPVDVKALRQASGMTQEAFASTYHLPIGTLRDWEQRRSVPDATARVLLRLIGKEPEMVARLLADA